MWGLNFSLAGQHHPWVTKEETRKEVWKLAQEDDGKSNLGVTCVPLCNPRSDPLGINLSAVVTMTPVHKGLNNGQR